MCVPYYSTPIFQNIDEVIWIDRQWGISLNDKAEFVRPVGMRITSKA